MKRSIFFFLSLLLCSVLQAAPVSRQQAQQKALQFLSAKGMHPSTLMSVDHKAARRAAGTDETAYYYVFNVGQNKGFVVMSGDDRTEAVLGYADSGEVDIDHMPDNMKAWLQGYVEQMKWMEEHNYTAPASNAQRRAIRMSVAPKLTTNWNQSLPYNLLCPTVGDQYTVTGCVATAIAQVLYYHRNEGVDETLAPIPSYTTSTLGITIPEIPVTTIDWANMKDNYVSSTDLDDPSNKAVATLMKCVGAMVEMDYGIDGSSAFTNRAVDILPLYFGYDKDIKYVNRNDYFYTDWIDLIYKELTTNGPVIYSGKSISNGHAFVIDGYDTDDLFHVNWGWGGNSNGYFRLALLSSSAQGIGGNAAGNGYSYLQAAIINLKPQDDGIDETTTYGPMSTYAIWTDTESFERNAANENFTFTAHQELYNNSGETGTFDFALALYKDNQFIKYAWINVGGYNLADHYGYSNLSTTVSLGADLADGIYQLIPVSRVHGTEVFYTNRNANKFYLILTISNNTLTIVRNGVYNLSGTIALDGEAIAGKPVNIKATLTNSYYYGYSGDAMLCYVDESTQRIMKTYAGQLIEVNGGETKEITFSFTPGEAGSYDLILLDKDYNRLTEHLFITVEANTETTTTSTLQINKKTDVKLLNGDFANGIYGRTVKGRVTVHNTGTIQHTSGLRVVLFEGIGGGTYSYSNTKFCDATIEAGGSKTIEFEFDGLTPNNRYIFGFYYATSSASSIAQSYSFACNPGITTFTANGTETTVAPASTFTVPEDAVAVDFSQITGVSEVLPNSNPNTLYFVNGGESMLPTGIDDKNVVKDGIAETLTLSDEYEFFTPVSFTAEKVSYTRQFTVGADGTKGWSTLLLPFNVESVWQGEKELSWFRSADESGKNFWLKEYVNENEATIYFNFANELKANTPYIIAVPGNKWGEKWNLTNKDITFKGSNATIAAQTTNTVTGNHYKFVGTLTNKELENVYVMNDDGTSFVKSDKASIRAFRAYFQSTDLWVKAYAALAIASETTGIGKVTTTQADDTQLPLYNLQGQRVDKQHKGIYVRNGKKFIVK